MIPRYQIDQVRESVDLAALVGSRVQLQSAGGNRLKGCCPFHQEKTPSFVVYTDKSNYHCFGCHEHGDAISWLMHFDSLTYPEAVRQLARQAGIELREEASTTPERQDPGLEFLQQVAEWFTSQLAEHPNAGEARDYLKARGLDQRMQSDFCLGYAPPGWDNLTKWLGDDAARLELAHKFGLLKRKPTGSRGYDAFRQRLIFPIVDKRGMVRGFGGRSLHADQQPKYLNSSESKLFTKGRLLYGEYQALGAGKVPMWLVTEGYMDVIAFHQYGFPQAVACLGTAISEAQIAEMLRRSRRMCFVFDGDAAGRKAAIKAMQLCKSSIAPNNEFSFLLLPRGEDPDSLLRSRGAEAMRNLLSQRLMWSQFFTRWVLSQADKSSVEGKSAILDRAHQELKDIRHWEFHTLLMRDLKNELGLGRSWRTNNAPSLPRSPKPSAQKRQQTTLLKLLAASMHTPEVWRAQARELLPKLQLMAPPLPAAMVTCFTAIGEGDVAVQLAALLSENQRNELARISREFRDDLDPARLGGYAREVECAYWESLAPEQRNQLLTWMHRHNITARIESKANYTR